MDFETLKIIITAETDKLNKAVKDSMKDLKEMNKVADVAMGVVVAGAAAAGAAVIGLGLSFAKTTSDIDDASKRVGMSAEEFQKWGFAAKQSGIELGTLEGLMKKQQTIFADAASGSATAAAAYQALGLDITKLGDSSTAFDAVIMKLADMTDETQRNKIANDIFGKSYADLGPLLMEGSAGITALKDEASALGAVISNETVASGAQFGDTIDKLKALFDGLIAKIGEYLLPYLQQFADWVLANKDTIFATLEGVINGIGNAIKWVGDNMNWLLPIVMGLAGAFVTLKIITAIMTVYNWLLNASFLANPITWVVLAIGALIAIGALLIMNWDKIIGFLGKLWDGMKNTFGKIGSFVGDVFKGVINGFIDMINFVIKGVNFLVNAWLTPFNLLIKGWNATLGKLIGKIPEISVSIPFVPKLANGGMLDAGSLFVAGEAGAELVGTHQGKTTVMPLENTNFVAAMKQAVIEGMTQSSSDGNITLVIDGMVLAKATEKNLNKLSTLQGGLNIAL